MSQPRFSLDFEIGAWKARANGAEGVLDRATMFGGFTSGRGEFFGVDSLDGLAIYVRFVFSNITPTSFAFEQTFSADAARRGK